MIITLAIAALLVALATAGYATHSYTFTWARGSETFAQTISYTQDGEKNFDASVAGLTVNQEIDIAFVKLKVNSMIIFTDQAITIKTNSSGSPQETLTIAASSPWLYRSDDNRANPFAGDVTKMFISVPGAAAATVKIRILEDTTP